MIRNILLDWSGTLVDDLPAVWETTNHVFRLAGVRELTLEEFRAEFSLPFPDYYRRVLPTHVPVERLETWFHDRFRQVQGSIRELPRARDFLEFCRRTGFRLFLLTTVPEEHFRVQSAANGFDQYFEHLYLGIRDKRQKIGEILATHRLRPDETVFVGDMQHDIDTAHQGGIRSCAVLTGYNGLDQLRASRPDLVVEHLGELRRLLEQSGGDPFRPPDPATPNSPNHAPIATVGALIFREDHRALLVRTRKWSNLWGIPGGKIQRGETAEAALRRELLEETNLAVDDIRFVLAQDCIDSAEFYRPAHFVLLNYTCACAAGPAVHLNDEAQEYQWVSLEEALALSLNLPTRRLIEAVRSRDQKDLKDLHDAGATPPLGA